MVSSSNTLFVGGSFTIAGGAPASGVAAWDGTNWSALGSGVAGQVYALALNGANLYVGGAFHSAGGIPATNIAKWNGKQWESLGGGLDQGVLSSPGVLALYDDGTNLFAGGQFLMAGDQNAYNIARWDGTTWHSMGTGVYLPDDPAPWGAVWSVTGDGTNVYVGGMFVQAGNVAATNIARWDGSNWYSMGDCTGGSFAYTYQANLISGIPRTLVMHQGSLFAGGSFGMIGGVPATNLASWDGSHWHNAGDVQGDFVGALDSGSGNLYVAGRFTSVAGVATANAAIWTSGSWVSLDARTPAADGITCIKRFGPLVCLGGSFGRVNGISAGNTASWNGSNWVAFGSGSGNSLDGTVYALATDGSNVYATGSFGTAGTSDAYGVAKWDGASWSSVGSLPAQTYLSFFGNAVAVAGSNIFVGGSFTMPDSGVTNLALWNGSSWISPGGPFSSVFVSSLLAIGNMTYLSGNLVDASNHSIGPVAFWDGTNWENIPGYADSIEDKLATDQTNLFVARSLYDVDLGDYSVQVTRSSGTHLNFIGGSFSNRRASALAISGRNIYLAASITTNNYAPALYCWNGSSWQSMASPFTENGFIAAMLALRGNLYVAGSFTNADNTPAKNIAKWNGAQWLCLESGVGYPVAGADNSGALSMIALGRKIFVGGQFATAGGVESENFAVWNEAPEIRLANPGFQAGAGLAFDVLGVPGDQVEIQTSSSVGAWTPLVSYSLTNEAQTFCDLSATNPPSRFYRARLIH